MALQKEVRSLSVSACKASSLGNNLTKAALKNDSRIVRAMASWGKQGCRSATSDAADVA